jgi:O-antigen/teichoic acid export membrane protein
LAPLLVLQYSKNLFLITAALVMGRLVACGVYFAVCLRVMPALRSDFAVRYAAIKPLFHFGAWMTVTNVIGPLMVYLDRFVIGGIISVAAVAYYATPYEIVTKLWIIPIAILGVLFPAFAASYRNDRDRTARLFARGTKYVALSLFPVTLAITAFAREGLLWWLGDEFARQSTSVLQWLAIGVFINSLAMVFITFIQGIGRPDLSAKLHLVELPIYLSALWWAIDAYGVQGAAMAWTGRVALDGILLFWLSRRFLGGDPALFKRMSIGMFAALGGLLVPLLGDGFIPRVAMASMTLVSFVGVAWFVVLAPDERARIRSWIDWLTGRRSGDVRR